MLLLKRSGSRSLTAAGLSLFVFATLVLGCEQTTGGGGGSSQAKPKYGISLSKSGDYPFEAVPEALTVTITNTGDSATGELSVVLSGDDASSFTLSTTTTLSAIKIASIDVDGTADFTVAPIAELDARDTPYTATVTVSGGNGISAGFGVSFTVIDPTYGIALYKEDATELSSTSTLTIPSENVDYAVPPAKTVTITNTGNQPTGNLTVELDGDDASSFTLSTTAPIDSIAAGGKATFTVTPETGLTARDTPYTATVTVSGGANITEKSFKVSFKVNPPEPSYSIGLSPSSLDFGSATVGYGTQTAKSVTINNTGNQPTGNLKVLSTNTDFTVTQPNPSSITATNGEATFTVTPQTGLSVGTHTATVKVSDGNGISASFGVSFTVDAKTYGIALKEEGSTAPISTLTFQSAIVDYDAQTGKSVTVTNTGNQATGNLKVSVGADFEVAKASGSYASSITISSIRISDSFRVRPKTELTARDEPYTGTVTVSGGANITEKSFNVSFTVNAKTYGISLNQSGPYTFAAAAVVYGEAAAGYGAQTAKSVIVSNTGNQPTGNLTVALSGTNADSFTLSSTNITSIAAGGSDYFTVVPKLGLAEGPHTATVTVSGENITPPKSFGVSFEVKSYGINLSTGNDLVNNNTSLSFDGAVHGYTEAQTPKIFTIENTGNQPTGALTVSLSGTGSSSFTLSTETEPIGNIAKGGSNTFTVTPKTSLPVDEYTATVTVKGTNTTAKTFYVSFTVSISQLTLANGSVIGLRAADLGALCSDAGADTSIIVNGRSIIKNTIKDMYFDAAEFASETRLPDNFCRGFTNLTELDLSGFTSLESIGAYMLYVCTQFNRPIEIPEGVTTIGTGFFTGGHSFNSELTLPEGLTSIGDFFMQNCHAFDQPLILPEGLTSIGRYFLSAINTFNQPLTLPSTLTSIGDHFLWRAYGFNNTLTFTNTPELPSTLTSISSNFMVDCTAFNQDLTIPASVKTIHYEFMMGCNKFNKTLTLEGVTWIGDYFMNGCTLFDKPLTIPTTVTSIGNNFLNGCTNFNKPLTIPTTVTSIGNYFMNGCTAFNNNDQPLTIEATSIGNNFLNGCSSFNQPLTLEAVTSIGDNFMANLTGFNNTLTIEGTASIGNNFMNGCTAFNNNDQPLTIEATSIGYNFLNGCSTFNQPLTLEAVTSIGHHFLNGFDPNIPPKGGLVTVTFNNTLMLPSTLTSIGDAFLSDNPNFNKPLTIPSSVTSVGTYFLKNCNILTSTITIKCPATAFATNNDSFSTDSSSAPSYYPGITIAGPYKAAIMTRFPNRDSSPYRKLIAAQ